MNKNNNDKDTKESMEDELQPAEEESTVDGSQTAVDKEESCDCHEQIANLENQVKRTLADYQNLEKRVREERHNWVLGANKELLLRILPVFDTLVLASLHSDDATLKITTQQFLDVLKGEGVVKIETKGKHFDPKTMECVTTKPGEDGKVLEELRLGFTLGENVLRPAQVIVGSK